jgi:hypothetical protein
MDDENKIYDYSKSPYDIEIPKMTTIFPRHKPAPKKE